MTRDRRNPGELLGGLTRRHREAAGLTQRQLADKAGVSLGAVRDLEQGRTTRPYLGSVEQLMIALGLNQRQRVALHAARADAARSGSASPTGRNDGLADERSCGTLAGGLRLNVLGPLEAWRGAAPVALGTVRQRAVLGLLALHLGSGIRRDAIIDALWGEDPPASAVTIVQSQVSRLRRLLDPGRAAQPDSAMLRYDGTCYRLPAGVLSDAAEFAELADGAGAAAAAGDLASACERYERALGLWRGEPLVDVGVLHAHPAVAGLSGQRVQVVIAYADSAAAAGWHNRVIGDLRALAAREPLNEAAHARLMTALAATGQQAAALGVFDKLRRRLDTELGMPPGPELADTHMRVLRQDLPGTSATGNGQRSAPPRYAGRPSRPAPPRQLPPTVPCFVGRATELAALTDMLDQAADAGVIVISGTAGVGKTALAVHCAHHVAERYPDGQLYVNLRGYDPDQPMPAADALAGFLRALGVAGQDIPLGADERAALFRSLLAGRQALVVVDNAADVEQVRPLLPGAPACAAMVTSRDSLAGLVARDGARRLDLDLLPPGNAVGLLRTLIGRRVDADPGAAEALAAQCSRLPLALRVAAELAVGCAAVPLARLVGELADQRQRLDLLDAGGDPRTAVRAVFSWSCRHLDAGANRVFRLAGTHPGPALDLYAAAALSGTTVERVDRQLATLARVHLIQRAGPDRYCMHDLLRAYARELAASQESEEERRAALTGLFDHYLHTAATAMDTLYPAEHRRRPRIPPATAACPPVTRPAAARAWLDAERANLAAVAAHTATHGWSGHVTCLAATLFRHLDASGHDPEAIVINSHARRAAQRDGDRAGEATALTNLAAVDFRHGRSQQAAGHLQQAQALFREAGDRTGEARTLTNLGLIRLEQGSYQQAARHLKRAQALFREVGDRTGEARTVGNLGLIALRQGRLRQAAHPIRQALTLFRETGDRTGEAHALTNLGVLDFRQGRFQEAADHLERSAGLFRGIGNRAGEAHALTNLGDVHQQQGGYQQAASHHRRALTLFRDTANPAGEAEALNGLGEVFLASGQPGLARAQHGTALDLAARIGNQHQQARAHQGLASAQQAAGHPGQARDHRQEALALYARLGAPEADQLRAQLPTVGNHVRQEG